MASGYSQDGVTKQVIFVDYFTGTHINDADRYYPTIRKALIASLTKDDRVRVLDTTMTVESDIEKADSWIAAMENKTARMNHLKTLGYNYLLNVHVSSLYIQRTSLATDLYRYNATIDFVLTLTDINKGENVYSRICKLAGTTDASSPERTVDERLEGMSLAIYGLVNDNFKIESKILSIETMKKQEAETVLIASGSDEGVTKNLQFDVYIDEQIHGDVAKTKIGRITVNEVKSNNSSVCQVRDGGVEIKKAFDNKNNITLVSKHHRISLW